VATGQIAGMPFRRQNARIDRAERKTMNETKKGDEAPVQSRCSAAFEVGDLIEAILPYRLACGSGIYPRAVLVSVDPFVAVSEAGDMLWRATISPKKVKRICRASPEVLVVAMKRFESGN